MLLHCASTLCLRCSSPEATVASRHPLCNDAGSIPSRRLIYRHARSFFESFPLVASPPPGSPSVVTHRRPSQLFLQLYTSIVLSATLESK
ncbi:hypothetical protein PIB30_080241, partial [Stylosanthes scabra]|nr:hypothetical protein [Stylosanthes scabra]